MTSINMIEDLCHKNNVSLKQLCANLIVDLCYWAPLGFVVFCWWSLWFRERRHHQSGWLTLALTYDRRRKANQNHTDVGMRHVMSAVCVKACAKVCRLFSEFTGLKRSSQLRERNSCVCVCMFFHMSKRFLLSTQFVLHL